ncbi:hypothetical protein [Catenibacterium sp.]|uniref:hypothetical protein n=1 Tax=Catenibacterium sp. TaxID=2049022 RepID=UPI00258681BB|nr:hypothetical protein [Catenibacterium sp.]
MKWFDLVMAIFYAFGISINIVGMVASFNMIRRYNKFVDHLYRTEIYLECLENQRKQG